MLPAAVRRSSVHIPYGGIPQHSESMREMQSAQRKIRSHLIIGYEDLFGTHNIQVLFNRNGERMPPDHLPHRLAHTPRYITIHQYNFE